MPSQISRLKRDKKGYYYRNLGRLADRSGTPTKSQPKFLLGRDQNEALSRLSRLEGLWKAAQHNQRDEEPDLQPTWSDELLGIAKAICRGEHIYRLDYPSFPAEPNNLDSDKEEMADLEDDKAWWDSLFAGYLREMQELYPVITFIPADEAAFQNGVRKNLEVARSHQNMADDFAQDAGVPTVRNFDETLHKALRAYVSSIDANPTYRNLDDCPGSQPLKAWGYKVQWVATDFLGRYEDRPLSVLNDLEEVQSLFDYWRNRPKSAHTGKPIKPKTVKNRLTVLTLFLNWLHRSKDYSWRKPADFDEIERSVGESKEERSAKARPDQVETYAESELTVLYRNTTTPLERLVLLVALNCGFKQAEVGTLLLGETYLSQRHAYSDLLDFVTHDDDSFIKRIRLKTGVYGEFKLWPATAQGIQWLIERRRKQTEITSGTDKGCNIRLDDFSVLLTRKSGYPMYRLYKSGNPSQDISSVWDRVVRRAAKDEHTISQHTYSALRRTTANMIRRSYDGEVASLFLSHGSPFKEDRLLEEYANRPFGRLFRILDEIGERLQPVFESVSDPFPAIEKKGGANISPKTIREIRRLLADGNRKSEIARIVGVHRTTVHRYAS